MPTISINTEDLLNGLETDLTLSELEELLAQLGTDVESVTEDETEVEIFPNRPDLLSTQGLLRNLKGLLDEESGLVDYDVKPSNYNVTVTDDVAPIRGKTACAVIKGIDLDQDDLEELITLQEKIHVTYGRERKRCAIGLYPLEKISFPVTYTALPPETIQFTPLGSSTEHTAESILANHEKGEAYSHLLEDEDRYPVFRDDDGSILSLPPVINSKHTGEVTTSTESVFIECSGHDLQTVKRALNIVCAHLSDLGGTIHKVEVSYSDGDVTTPTLESVDRHAVSERDINDWLGTTLTTDEIKAMLGRMRHDAGESETSEIINVSNNTYRIDLLGKSDIIEEIAIGYGFNTIEPDSRREHTNGSKSEKTRFEDKIRDYLIGSGFQEVYTYSLTNSETARNISREQPVELLNSLSDNYNALRSSVVPEHLSVLEDNAHYSYPQQIFEVGRTFRDNSSQATGVKEKIKLCITISGDMKGFSELQKIITGLNELFEENIRVVEGEHPAMIDGRTASLITNNDVIGFFGEIHPRILTEYDVTQPTAIGELSIHRLTTQ